MRALLWGSACIGLLIVRVDWEDRQGNIKEHSVGGDQCHVSFNNLHCPTLDLPLGRRHEVECFLFPHHATAL